MRFEGQRIRDPAHDLIDFGASEFDDVLRCALQTQPIQRLRRIKQRGFSDFVHDVPIILQLDPHLAVLAVEFAMSSPAPAGQLELFPAWLVSSTRTEGNNAADVDQQQTRRRV